MVSRRRRVISCPIHLQNAHPSLIDDEEIYLNGVLVIVAIWNRAAGVKKLTSAPAEQSGNPEPLVFGHLRAGVQLGKCLAFTDGEAALVGLPAAAPTVSAGCACPVMGFVSHPNQARLC